MVRTDELPVALLAFMAFVVVAPLWIRYQSGFAAAQMADRILAAAVLPAVALLFLSSWVRPELSRLVLGGFMLFGVMVLAPWFVRFTGMVSRTLADDPLAQLALQAAVPLIVLSFVVSLGMRRMAAG